MPRPAGRLRRRRCPGGAPARWRCGRSRSARWSTRFSTRKLSFLKSKPLVSGRRDARPTTPSAARRARRPCGVPEAQRPAYVKALADLARSQHDRDPGRRRVTAVVPAAPGRRPADRPVRVRPGRADLPDLGAHLRLQPGVRALPVLLGTAGPARAVHRRGRGGHRRAAADAGLLRQRRRRRADRAAGLLAPARLRDRPRRRRQVLHQRRQARPGRGRAQLAAHRLRRRADLPGRRDRRGQRPRPRRPAPSPPRPGRWRTWPRPG